MWKLLCVNLIVLFLVANSEILTEEAYLQEFTKFRDARGKRYSSLREEKERFSVFKSNLDYINAHNSGNFSWKLGINEFSDLTNEEFIASRTGVNFKSLEYFMNSTTLFDWDDSLIATGSDSDSIDWREKKVVTPVKNQGQCGSCWSFATTGAIESAVAIKSGNLISLSEQKLIDCSSRFGNSGCNGGLPSRAYKYVIAHKGLCSESAYPYTAKTGTCQTSCPSVAKIKKFKRIRRNHLDGLKAALTQQPISVVINADQLQHYESGVFDGACSAQINHAVLAVGYGTDSDSNLDYWLVKNSWGAAWGEEGYFRLSRKGGIGPGKCAIATGATFPIAA
jgi:C1A family cysteine protease